MTSVLVFATSGVTRLGIESVIRGSNWLTLQGSVSTLDGLAQALDRSMPDVVVADIREDDSEIRELLDDASAVVMLIGEDDQDLVRQAMVSGRRGVLSRSAGTEEILSAIDGVRGGLVVLDSHMAAQASEAIPAYARSSNMDLVEDLTQREMEVLGLLAEALGNKMIARRLGISEHTVKFHIASIFGKLGAGTRTEAVTIGIRQGLISI